MTMQSLELLPELRKLPAAEEATLDVDETVARIRTMDRGHFAIEVSQATEEVLEALFKWRNVPDELDEAWPRSFSDLAEQGISLHERYEVMTERGLGSVVGFVSNLKGKVAELRAESALEELYPGYDFKLAASPTQPVWDLRGISPDQPVIDVQVKIRAEEHMDIVGAMQEHPNMPFVVSRETYDVIEESYPELVRRAIDIGPAAELTESVKDGLDTLARNSGLDVPDSIGEALPYVGEVVLGIKLIWGIISTERELADVDLTDRSRLHGIRTLALASRFGINQVCMWAGGAGGTAAGSVVPGVGNIAAGLAGGLGGIGGGMALNKLLQPRIDEVAMKLVGGDTDDIFYLMNKVEVDRIGESLAATQVG